MLSLKVIFAAEVLLRMDAQSDTQEKGCQDFDVRMLYDEIDVSQRSILRCVIRQLMQSRYIEMIGQNKFLLLKKPAQITLLNLVSLFHGGVCIGELFDHYQMRGRENFTTETYRQLMIAERRLNDDLHTKLADITLAHLAEPLLKMPSHQILVPDET